MDRQEIEDAIERLEHSEAIGAWQIASVFTGIDYRSIIDLDFVQEYHERLLDLLYLAQAGANMSRCVSLPTDADDNVIYPGDALVLDGTVYDVVALQLGCDGKWEAYLRSGGGGFYCGDLSSLRHHCDPTVESVLWELIDSLDLDSTSHVDTRRVVAEYADRFMLREDDGGQG